MKLVPLWVVVLTLLVWVAFWYAGQHLDQGETLVVAVIVAVLLVAVQAVRSRLQRSKSAAKPP